MVSADQRHEVRHDTAPIAVTHGIEADVNWIGGRELPDASRDAGLVTKRNGRSSRGSCSNELWLLDWKTGKSRRLSDPAECVREFAWSPIDTAVAYAFNLRSDDDEFVGSKWLAIEHVETRGVRKHQVSEKISNLQWSPNGDRLAAIVFESQSGGSNAVAVLDGLTGAVVKVVAERNPETRPSELSARATLHDPSIRNWSGGPIWTSDGLALIVEAQGRMRSSLWGVQIETDEARELFSDSNYYRVADSPTGSKQVLVVGESPAQPERLYLLNTSTDQLREIFNPSEEIAERAWPVVEDLSWPSGDGKFEIHGVLLAPSLPSGAHKLPLIVYVNGGPSSVVMRFDFDAQPTGIPLVALASQGYLVLCVNSRGRNGYGDKLYSALNEEHSTYDHPFVFDIVSGVDLLVDSGKADPQRLGISGMSYGGAVTAWAITKSDRFRAASISEAAGEDNLSAGISIFGNPTARNYMMNSNFGYENPYTSAGRRIIESPIAHVETVHTPNLNEYGINAGAVNEGRPWFQAMQYFGIPSELVVFPRSGHGWYEPLLQLDSYQRNLEWFNYWLKDLPYPDQSRQKGYDAWILERTASGDPRWSGAETHK
jgi:dipeptidyl aminopeptidase/acylaminoacyl peptidase